MKKMLVGISAMLLLTGTQVLADYNPFLNENGTVNAVTGYDIYNYSTAANDSWADGIGYETKIDLTNPLTEGYYSGIYLGTFGGNDVQPGNDRLTPLLSWFLYGNLTTTGFTIEKVESGDSGTATFSVEYLVEKTKDGKTEYVAGSWETDGTYNVDFYSVKSSNYFALYLISPADDFGYWSTIHIPHREDLKGLSHISGSLVPNPVPEPATMLLFGTGLAGLAAVARRRKN